MAIPSIHSLPKNYGHAGLHRHFERTRPVILISSQMQHFAQNRYRKAASSESLQQPCHAHDDPQFNVCNVIRGLLSKAGLFVRNLGIAYAVRKWHCGIVPQSHSYSNTCSHRHSQTCTLTTTPIPMKLSCSSIASRYDGAVT